MVFTIQQGKRCKTLLTSCVRYPSPGFLGAHVPVVLLRLYNYCLMTGSLKNFAAAYLYRWKTRCPDDGMTTLNTAWANACGTVVVSGPLPVWTTSFWPGLHLLTSDLYRRFSRLICLVVWNNASVLHLSMLLLWGSSIWYCELKLHSTVNSLRHRNGHKTSVDVNLHGMSRTNTGGGK